jgi:hypothetical protein
VSDVGGGTVAMQRLFVMPVPFGSLSSVVCVRFEDSYFVECIKAIDTHDDEAIIRTALYHLNLLYKCS